MEQGRGNMGFLRVPNNSETDMWQKSLIAILDIYRKQVQNYFAKGRIAFAKSLKYLLAALFLARFTRKLL